jgi:hypothetical protein
VRRELRVRVRDDRGPVPESWVVARYDGVHQESAFTDAEGLAVIEDLPDVPCTIRVEGGSVVSTDVGAVFPGRGDVDVAAPRRSRVRGTVRLPGGTPPIDASVTLYAGHRAVGAARTDASGAFSAEVDAPHGALLQACASWPRFTPTHRGHALDVRVGIDPPEIAVHPRREPLDAPDGFWVIHMGSSMKVRSRTPGFSDVRPR